MTSAAGTDCRLAAFTFSGKLKSFQENSLQLDGRRWLPPVILTAAIAPLPALAQAQMLASWDATAEAARAGQPHWSSPIATTTSLLEQRFRLDVADEHAGNGADTVLLDGGKGLDLIVSETNDIQLALPPYQFRSAAADARSHAGFGDWAFFRFKQRLASSPGDQGDYVVSAWLQ